MAKSLALSLRNVYETLAISWPTVVDAVLDRVDRETCDRRLASWAKRVTANARIDLEVHGASNYDPSARLIVMSNHQSFYDVPVLYAVLGGNLRMVAKKELFAVPIFSRAMREAGFIEVDRSNRQRALDSMKLAKQTLLGGVNVWIAPEGTRSRTGELGPFKKGGFYLAFETGLPILPVSLVGTRDALGAQALRSSAGAHVRVTIAPPIDTAAYIAQGKPGRERLMSAVRAEIQRGLDPQGREP